MTTTGKATSEQGDRYAPMPRGYVFSRLFPAVEPIETLVVLN